MSKTRYYYDYNTTEVFAIITQNNNEHTHYYGDDIADECLMDILENKDTYVYGYEPHIYGAVWAENLTEDEIHAIGSIMVKEKHLPEEIAYYQSEERTDYTPTKQELIDWGYFNYLVEELIMEATPDELTEIAKVITTYAIDIIKSDSGDIAGIVHSPKIHNYDEDYLRGIFYTGFVRLRHVDVSETGVDVSAFPLGLVIPTHYTPEEMDYEVFNYYDACFLGVVDGFVNSTENN